MANTIKQKSRHPSRDQLAGFLRGTLPSNLQSAVEKHVLVCDSCVQLLENVHDESDTLGIRIKDAATHFESLKVAEDDDQSVPTELANHSRYEVKEKIGSGGMGDVYRALQRSMDRPVAIKVLRRHLFENDRAVARFHKEIKIAALLNHVNIVHSYDADVTGGLNILVMELVEGSKISEFVQPSSPLPVPVACRYAAQVIQGLNYADSKGMTHRDIKPQNLMVTSEGLVKITDFGLAKFSIDKVDGNGHSLTLDGETFGTPDYIAPEQIRDSSTADRRSDIYSLGCTLYFMLTGRPPFGDISVGEKLASHLEKEPPDIHVARPDLPAELVQVIRRMMHKDPERRFQDYTSLAEAIVPFQDAAANEFQLTPVPIRKPDANQETAVDLAPTGAEFPTSGFSRYNRKNLVLGGCISLLVIIGLLFGFGVLPSPFLTASAIKRIAVVVPAESAWHPEINKISNYFASQENVELEWIAEKKGRVSFNGATRDSPDPRKLVIDRVLSEVGANEFDSVIFTGGWTQDQQPYTTVYAFDDELNAQAREFVEAMMAQKKPVASVGGGTVVLSKAQLLRGTRVANCQYICDEARNESGAIWSDLEQNPAGVVVRDGLIVTASTSKNLDELCETIMSLTR